MDFVLFTDNLADLSVREACRAAKQAGFSGLDLTVRPGGHVLPKDAAHGLPEAFRIADEEGMSIPMISTAITDAKDGFAEEIISAAHFRMRDIKIGYFNYKPFGTLTQQLDVLRRRLEPIVALSRRYHVRPCLHVHSGPGLYNSAVIYEVLKDYRPEDLGVYLDPMHMSLEGGLSGWEMTLDLIAPWVALVAVKNFDFVATKRDADGQQQFRWRLVPVADGIAPIPRFFKRLKQIPYNGVVSLHSEYTGSSSWRRLKTPELLMQSATDLAYLKVVLA